MGLFGDIDEADIDNIPDDPFKLPNGKCILTVGEAVKKTDANSHPGLQIKWVNGANQTISEWYTLPYGGDNDSRSLANLKQLYVALGIPRSKWSEIEPNEDNVIEEFLGIECEGIVTTPTKPNKGGYINQSFQSKTRIGGNTKSAASAPLSGITIPDEDGFS